MKTCRWDRNSANDAVFGFGGPYRNRTYNLWIKSPLLYLVELTARLGWTMGLEPTTTGITIQGSTN